MLEDDKKKELIGVLSGRLNKYGKGTKCPMCGHSHFTIADAYLLNILQPDLKSVTLGGPSIPSLAIVCTNCGFISQHSLGVLGLLPRDEATDEPK